jgi:hypothetical protein
VAMAADVVVPGSGVPVDDQPAPGRGGNGSGVRTNVTLWAAVVGAVLLILVAAAIRRTVSRRPQE